MYVLGWVGWRFSFAAEWIWWHVQRARGRVCPDCNPSARQAGVLGAIEFRMTVEDGCAWYGLRTMAQDVLDRVGCPSETSIALSSDEIDRIIKPPS